MNNYSKLAKNLITNQITDWEMAKKNYMDLGNVQVKEILFDNFTIKVQFNPGRIRSSAAKVDAKTLSERPCFLCKKNRPKEQSEITILEKYDILINPFPIFEQHLTISDINDVPQLLKGRMGEMLEISRLLDEFTVFYNGPKCGASAPDHFHFQAGNNDFLPIGTGYANLIKKYGKLLKSKFCELWAVDDSIRKILIFSSDNAQDIENEFNRVYELLEKRSGNSEEPAMNILTRYVEGRFLIIMFLRGAHRPWQYTAEGDANILVTPASVEFGGILITPLEKDFLKIAKEDIIDIFKQTSIHKELFDEFLLEIQQNSSHI